MKLDSYIRVSKVGKRKGERFISPEVQKKQNKMWAALREVTIGITETDLDKTGKVLSRPGLDRILARIRNKEADGIIVASIDRLSRAGVADALRLVEEIVEAGGTIAVVDLGIDPTTTFGEFAITVMLALSRMQSRQIGDKWGVARGNAIDRGVFVGGTVPVGLRKREDGRLERDPTVRRELIPDFFERRAGQESWTKVARWLSAELGYSVSVPTCRAMIANPTYLGEVRGGGDLVNRTAHEPLVDRALWEAANAVKGVVPARSGRSAGLLSGLLRCAGCRYAMKASMNKSAGGLEYRCKTRSGETAEGCTARASVSAHLIDDLVVGRFRGWAGDYELAQLEGSEGVEEAEHRLLGAEVELDAALDTRLSDALGSDSDRYLSLVADRQTAVDAARDALVAAKGIQVALPAGGLAEVWPDLPLHDRRRLLASALDCVFVRKGTDLAGRTHLCWRGEAPDLPRRGVRWSPLPFDFPA